MGTKPTKREQATTAIMAAAAAVVLGWSFQEIPRGFVTVASGVLAVLCLTKMPTWCCATRVDGGQCRNRTLGIFRGCSQIPQHGQQKSRMVRTKAYWLGLAKGCYSGWRGMTAVGLAIAATLSGLVGLFLSLTS
jgi:predicted branched-subunit amino acid permease